MKHHDNSNFMFHCAHVNDIILLILNKKNNNIPRYVSSHLQFELSLISIVDTSKVNIVLPIPALNGCKIP